MQSPAWSLKLTGNEFLDELLTVDHTVGNEVLAVQWVNNLCLALRNDTLPVEDVDDRVWV